MIDLKVTGAEDLAALSKKLKATADRTLKRELSRGLRSAGKPLLVAARDSARDNLPSRGGLNDVVAASKFAVRTRTSSNASVRLTGTNLHDIKAMDRGQLRHPTFGNRNAWVTQQIRPGWWTERMERESPQVRTAIVHVIDDISRRL